MEYIGNTALITGAGKGIGFATAMALAKTGISVGVLALHSQSANNAANKITGAGGQAIALTADVSKQEMVYKAVTKLVDAFGTVDILINNAAAPAEKVLFHETNKKIQHDELITLTGTFNCTRAVISHMIKKREGRIINISSLSSRYGMPGRAIYCAANAGINAFTLSLSHEVGQHGITVNAISPGAIMTPRLKARSKKVKDEHMRMISIPRFGEPEDIANAVLFLVRKDSSYITGAILDIDGGFCGYEPSKRNN